MRNRVRLTTVALTLSMAGFGLTGYSREIKETVAKTEAADKRAGGVQATDTQANGDRVEGGQEEGSRTADGERYKVTLCLSGTANDMGWCQPACDGLKLLEADCGCEVTYMENLTPDDIGAAFMGCATSGYDVVISHGYKFGDLAVGVAEQCPDTKFVITEGGVSADSMTSYVSKCEEGRYVMGMLAAGVPENGEVGFIGPIQGAFLVKVMNGFEDGAKEVNPGIQVQTTWTDSFTDTALGKEAAQAMIDNGADVIEHCADESGTGAISAAKEAKVYATSDFYNRNDLAPDTIPSSSVYHIPHVIEVAFKMVVDGTFGGGIDQLGVADGAVGVTSYRNLDSVVPDELKQKISDKITAIESGTSGVACNTKPGT